ncbi:30S ribosomal protein S6 [Durusdinium trenchii]|uniref:30S ribosomal protein S6 n=1 Tax=Durusdinium trenchii TaxID=1381693 RepID=A0ABP0QNF7_9DINO
MFDGLPHSAHSIINNDEWHGGSIVRLDSALCRPAAADVAINYHMLKPVITHSPDKVCSGYFLTDCLLALDDLFQGKMLVGASGSKLDMAAEEAVKLKKLMGAGSDDDADDGDSGAKSSEDEAPSEDEGDADSLSGSDVAMEDADVDLRDSQRPDAWMSEAYQALCLEDTLEKTPVPLEVLFEWMVDRRPSGKDYKGTFTKQDVRDPLFEDYLYFCVKARSEEGETPSTLAFGTAKHWRFYRTAKLGEEELPSPIDDEDAITVYGKKSVRLPYGFHATKELLSHEIAIPGKQHAPSTKKRSKAAKGKAVSKVSKDHLKEVCAGTFKTYNLKTLGIPKEAWCTVDKEYKGKHGYTMVSEKTNAAIEVLLNKKAYYVKRCGNGVVALLATLVFSCGGLDWSPIDHFETFAGDQSITKGEIAEHGVYIANQRVTSWEEGFREGMRWQRDDCQSHDLVLAGFGHSEIDDLLEERRPPLQLADSDRPQMTVKYIDGSGKARFGKAVAKVRTRNQKRIRNAACRFLRASFKTEHVLDRSKATHAHWMKHANLASVLHFLASKQLGAD